MLALAVALTLIAAPRQDAAILAKASREDVNGWIILHLAGTPREIGYEHGYLAAPEIDHAVKVFATAAKLETGKDWAWYKETAKRLFLPKLDPEYRQEIDGIAKGAKAHGVLEDSDDILALNSYIELSDYYLPYLRAKQSHSAIVSGAPLACSAFVATGSATRDGKVVMGHNFWWGYFTGENWRIVLDVKPDRGVHFMMDAAPGFIDSGTDWAINQNGIGLCETTISGFTGFDENGIPEFQRMRKAIQYSKSLADVESIFKAGNNGGYANTWLMVDAKTNTIGKLQLGLKNVVFNVASDGYYYGANFPEDPKLAKEDAPDYHGECDDRKARWAQVLAKNKGQIDAEVAQGFLADTYDSITKKNDGFGGGALCSKGMGGGAINAKVVTGDMLEKMQFWGRMGVPDGSDLTLSKAMLPSAERDLFFEIKGNPWTVLTAKSGAGQSRRR